MQGHVGIKRHASCDGLRGIFGQDHEDDAVKSGFGLLDEQVVVKRHAAAELKVLLARWNWNGDLASAKGQREPVPAPPLHADGEAPERDRQLEVKRVVLRKRVAARAKRPSRACRRRRGWHFY